MNIKWFHEYKIEMVVSIGLHLGLVLLLSLSNGCLDRRLDSIKVITTVKLGSGGPGQPSHIAVKPPNTNPIKENTAKDSSKKEPKEKIAKEKITKEKEPIENKSNKKIAKEKEPIENKSNEKIAKEKEPIENKPNEKIVKEKEPSSEPSDDFDPSIANEPDVDPTLEMNPSTELEDPSITEVDPNIEKAISSNGGSDNPNAKAGSSSGPLKFGTGSAGDLELGLYEKACRNTIYQNLLLNYSTSINNTFVTVILKINPNGNVIDFKIKANDGDPQYLIRVQMVFKDLSKLSPPPEKWASVFEEEGVELTLRPNK